VIKESQQHWEIHAQGFTSDMAALLELVCNRLCSSHFKEYPLLAGHLK
jgi:hypothetical protein